MSWVASYDAASNVCQALPLEEAAEHALRRDRLGARVEHAEEVRLGVWLGVARDQAPAHGLHHPCVLGHIGRVTAAAAAAATAAAATTTTAAAAAARLVAWAPRAHDWQHGPGLRVVPRLVRLSVYPNILWEGKVILS
jgi:hypothetical protein